MITTQNINSKEPFWYFLSKREYNTDEFDKFIDNGYWRYYEDRVKRDHEQKIYRGYLREMKIGDPIAIYNIGSKNRHEFEQELKCKINTKRKTVSYIIIKAIGKIVQPCTDNKLIGVNCAKIDDSRKWYRYTYKGPIWRVFPESKQYWGENLIDFTFNGENQDLARLKAELKK